MKVTSPWRAFAGWFDGLQLRERALIAAATLAVILAVCNSLVLQRLEARKQALSQQLADIVAQVQGAAGAVSAVTAPDQEAAHASAQMRALSASLAQANARLESQSAGLIPPQRMTEVIHDVLSRQHGVELISLQSLPPYALLQGPADAGAGGPAGAGPANAGPASAGAAAPTSARDQGPYVHTVVLVVQGRYLDVLAYLQALENLPWHFYWQGLELDASHYPVSRVTVTLGTLSMSRDWIDL